MQKFINVLLVNYRKNGFEHRNAISPHGSIEFTLYTVYIYEMQNVLHRQIYTYSNKNKLETETR